MYRPTGLTLLQLLVELAIVALITGFADRGRTSVLQARPARDTQWYDSLHKQLTVFRNRFLATTGTRRTTMEMLLISIPTSPAAVELTVLGAGAARFERMFNQQGKQ